MYHSGVIGAADADILVSLERGSSADRGLCAENLRGAWHSDFPGVTFYFLPADMVTQILNFGLPAPIDIQIDGADIDRQPAVADQILARCARSPASSMRASSRLSITRSFDITVDRTKAAAERSHPARRRQQRARYVERQLPDHADVLPEPEERRQLQPRHQDTAIRDPDRCRICRTFRSRGRRQRIQRSWLTSRRSARSQRDGGGQSLQYPPRDRYLCLRARARSRRGRPRHHSASSTPTEDLLPRGSFVTMRGQIETMTSSYIDLLAGSLSRSCSFIC